jgi:hypothetical protein
MLTIHDLRKVCTDSYILELCLPVLDDSRFAVCPLNLQENSHYAHEGGVLHYTGELVSYGTLMCSLYTNYNATHINVLEYLVSAVWYNYGKCFEYEVVDGAWCKVDAQSKLDTSWRSALEFRKHVQTHALIETDFNISYDNILYNIISASTQIKSTSESILLSSAISLSQQLYQFKTHER